MLPGKYLRRRKWIIEHLSLRRGIFEDLSAFAPNTEHGAALAASVTAKQTKVFFFFVLCL